MSESGEMDLRVLFVEDSPDDALLALRSLEAYGYMPHHRRVDDRVQLKDAMTSGWDVVIQDASIPDLPMAEVLEIIREKDPELPVIIVSGTIGEEGAVEAMKAGMQDYILKSEGLGRLAPAVEREVRDAEHRRQRRRAQHEIRRLASIVESSADAIISLNLDGTIVSWNGGATRCFGFPKLEMTGESLQTILPDDRVSEVNEWLGRVREGASLTGQESRWLRKDGTMVYVSVTISPVRDESGAIVGASTVARDITYRKETETKLQYLADHDALTNLLNRRRFGRELSREIMLAQRFGGKGAVMVVDLDNFKAINDTLGHRAGDQVISRIADILKKSLRDVDIVARIGGDEFAVFMPDGNPEEVASRLGATIKKTVLGLGDGSIHTTASIGIADLTEEKLNEDELLARADMAMYEAKEAGRDCFRIYRPEDLHRERSSEGLKMSERIRGAVDAGEFEVYAQPILDLGQGNIHQHELLVRMKDGAGGLIMPTAFLPTADRFGMIEEVDRWMVVQAIKLLSELNGTEDGTCLSVNLSGRSMVDPDLFCMIEREIEAAGVCPQNLAFEVTETSVIENMDDARKLATRLKSLGCKLALDDFGAGFGSFYYLKHLPFDYLKIDGDFIRGLPGNQTDQYMVEAISRLAGRLGKKTVAEYVEDQDTLDLLREFGIDYAQGFHIGAPRGVGPGGTEEVRMASFA